MLDGAAGSMFQQRKLTEADFRGARFADHPSPLQGDNDLLCITRPDVVGELHDAYLASGADIVATNTFNSTSISQADYALEAAVVDINACAAKLARTAADNWTARTPDRPRYVAGSIGPLSRTLSISPDVNDPSKRAVTFDEVYHAYREQALALHAGDVDIFLVETVFDTLNAKAAIKAILDLEDDGLEPLPIWVSGTITDRSGRTLSGQTCGGVLELDKARASLRSWPELRARRRADAPARGRALAPRRLPGLSLPQRRPAQRLRRIRRAAARDGLPGGRVGGERHRQHPRRLLRHHPRTTSATSPRRWPASGPRSPVRRPVAMRLSGLEPFELA